MRIFLQGFYWETVFNNNDQIAMLFKAHLNVKLRAKPLVLLVDS